MNLNNKGITMVELLVCFLLISFISVSLFNSVSLFSNKRVNESVKADLLQYRNEVVKLIEDDLIGKGLTDADVTVREITADNHEGVEITNNSQEDGSKRFPRIAYEVKLRFRDNTSKELVIYSQKGPDFSDDHDDTFAGDEDSCYSGQVNDDFYILYGEDAFSAFSSSTGDYVKYPLPNVGSYENDCPSEDVIRDLRFGRINVSADENVLYIYINFDHPELGNNYSINIVAPINYF